MDFDQTITQVKETLIVTTELQRRYAEGQNVQPDGMLDAKQGFALHMLRMKHIDMRLASISDKMRRMRDGSN